MKNSFAVVSISMVIAAAFVTWLYLFVTLVTKPTPPQTQSHGWSEYQEWEDGSFKGTTTQGIEIVGCKQTGTCWQNDGVDLE